MMCILVLHIFPLIGENNMIAGLSAGMQVVCMGHLFHGSEAGNRWIGL